MATNYKAIAKKLKFEGRAFINGKYVNAIDGKKFETINPATGEKIKIGGLALKTLKKLKGLRFTFPLESMVLAKLRQSVSLLNYSRAKGNR